LGRLNVGVLLGFIWILLVSLYLLDWNWGRIGLAPPGQVFLINTANEPLTYSTTPPVSDASVTWGIGRKIDPGGVRALHDLPSDGPLRISAVTADGTSIFCAAYTPESLARANGRVEISAGIDTCN